VQIEKLVEMTSAMTEYLSMQAPSRDPFSVGPREHLNQIISMIAMSRNGDHRFLPLLMNKMSEVLPRITNPMLQNAPENSNLANIDIFDGFGNAGMAQPPSQMHMSMGGADFDRKFSVEEYEKMNGNTPESASNSNASSGSPPMAQQGSSDMNGSFVSSPGIMSPSMEYPHNMNGFACTPMSEMVMSPLGNPSQSASLNAPQGQHHQHLNHGHESMSHVNRMTQGIRNQSTSSPSMSQSHSINFRLRQNSFHVQPQLQAVGEYHNLQRTDSDTSGTLMTMGSMNGELGFGPMR